MNMGGPRSLDEVRPFLFRLFRDPDILPLPRWLRWLSWPIAALIAFFRAPKSSEAYRAIGGGSPQLPTNLKVADKLQDALAEQIHPESVKVAMRYWHPFTDDALDQLEAIDVDKIVALPMYPHYSTTTTMSSYRELHRRLTNRRKRWSPDIVPVLDYHLDSNYLSCVESRTRAAIDRLKFPVEQCLVLYSAHSIPADRVRDLDDPYPQQIESMVAALSERLPAGLRYRLAYQSRVGPVEWIGPSITEVIPQLAAEAVMALVVVPISFVSEHVETLEEIDLQYRELAEKHGIRQFERVDTVQEDDDFIAVLKNLTLDALVEAAPKKCRCEKSSACICLGSVAA